MIQRKDKNGESMEVGTGMGRDPGTGKMGPYEEGWKCVQLVNIPWYLSIPSFGSFFRLIKVSDPFGHALICEAASDSGL